MSDRVRSTIRAHMEADSLANPDNFALGAEVSEQPAIWIADRGTAIRIPWSDWPHVVAEADRVMADSVAHFEAKEHP